MSAKKFGSGFLGNQLIVHDNRVEIRSGFWPFRRKRIIPFSNISNVEKARMANVVTIHTNDGKKHKYSVGSAGKIQDAIMERM